MGVNISGFVINRNLKEEIPVIEETLGIKLKFENKIHGSEASCSKYNSKFIDIQFTEKGTLVYMDDPYFNSNGFGKLAGTDYELMSFRFSETAMVFGWQFFGNTQNESMWIMYDDGFKINRREKEATLNFGDKAIKISENKDIVFDVFGEITEAMIGINFNHLSEHEAARYSVIS